MAEIDPAQARRTHRIVWSTLLAAQLVYVALLLSGAVRVRETPPDIPAFPIALSVVGLSTAIGAHILWRRASGAGQPIHTRPPDPARAFTFYLLAWVLDESIAIYGLVLGLLAFEPAVWAPFSAGAFALMLVHRPA
jgi:F0F1-type ATP synthase membrane subunit c/vacuolar-type H+-ATPase subunit K